MITEFEKTNIDKMCKQFIVDKEIFFNGYENLNIQQYMTKNIDADDFNFEYGLYDIIKNLFVNEMIKKYKWGWHWGDELEYYVRNNNYFTMCLKIHKQQLKTNRIKKDFE